MLYRSTRSATWSAAGYAPGITFGSRCHLDDYFIHKCTEEASHGERTSLTRKPIQVGAVTIPAGNICAVDPPAPLEHPAPKDKLLRLSMFAFFFDERRSVFPYHFRIIGRELRGENDKRAAVLREKILHKTAASPSLLDLSKHGPVAFLEFDSDEPNLEFIFHLIQIIGWQLPHDPLYLSSLRLQFMNR